MHRHEESFVFVIFRKEACFYVRPNSLTFATVRFVVALKTGVSESVFPLVSRQLIRSSLPSVQEGLIIRGT